MRIWAFPSMYPYDYPGMAWSGIFAHRQYKGLIQRGADLKVIIPVSWHPPFPFSLLHADWKRSAKFKYPLQRVYDGITVYHPRIANIKPARLSGKPNTERFIDAIVNFFRSNNIKLNPSEDIFYSQWIPDAIFVQRTAHKLGVKSAILGIGDDVIVYPRNNEEYLRLFRDTLTQADLRIVNAEFLAREANNILGTDLHFDVIYFGVDYDLFKPCTADEVVMLKKEYGIPNDKIIILTVAAALKRKGWIDLFEALRAVKKVNSNFVLAGIHSAPKDIDIVQLVADYGLTTNFINLGEVKPAVLNKLYNIADIFCLPSHWEGLATVIIEAMSSGVAVLTTDVGGHAEMINSGVNGILIPPKEPAIIAENLLALMADGQKRTYLGKNARNFIVNHLGNYAENAGKLNDVLSNALTKT